MSLNLSIRYDLRIATFSDEQGIKFIGKTKKWLWKINWTLFNSDDEIIAFYRIRQKLILPSSKLLLEYNDGNVTTSLTFFYKVWKGPHVKFDYKGDSFLIVFHIGNKFSFFRNDRQIAILEKERLSISLDKKYVLIADSDASINLIVAMAYAVLIITEDEFEEPGDFNVDLGNLGPELKAFDKTWTAKAT